MMSAMLFAMVSMCLSLFGLKIDLYNPICRPDGDVVVDSRQCLNSPRNLDVLIETLVS